MKKELMDLCNWVIDTAIQKGATDCKTTLSKRRFVEINYLDKKPEIIKEATTQNLSVEIFLNQKYAVQTTPDLRENTLKDFIDRAVENTHFMEDDPYRNLPDSKYYDLGLKKNLELKDPNHKNFTPNQRHEISKQIESSCLKKGGEKVISVEAGCYDSYNEELIVNSKGFSGHTESTEFWMGASMTAQDDGDRRSMGYHWVGTRIKEDLPDVKEVGIQAAENSLKKLGAKKIATEKLPVIIENRVSSRVLNGLMQAMSGRNIQQENSFLIGKKGNKIGSNILTLNDNPFKNRGLASRLYDREGLPATEMNPITNGILNDYYINWYYSRKLGVEPTTGTPSNLSIPKGEKSVSELMSDLKRGIIITGFIGGNSNSATGDFSIGITGHLFENGELVQPIAEMNIADNHLEFWKKLIATGNDPWQWARWNLPSLVFEDIVISGS